MVKKCLTITMTKISYFLVKWSEILTMTMAKIQIFHGQYLYLTITIVKIQISRGQMSISTVVHGANSRVSVAMVEFFSIDHGANSRVSWSWSMPYPPLLIVNCLLFIDYLYYISNLLKLRATNQKTPNFLIWSENSDQTSKPRSDYKWSRKVAFFGNVKEKGLT